MDNNDVFYSLYREKKLPKNADPNSPWPSSLKDSNFRFCYVDYSKRKYNTNYGHSEYQLLRDDGLEAMVTSFRQRHNGCPQYVILYTTNLPCTAAPKYIPPLRCAQMTVNARKNLMNICPETRFYVYITRNTPDTEYTQGFKFSVKDLFNEGKNGIEWLNPPPSDEGLGFSTTKNNHMSFE